MAERTIDAYIAKHNDRRGEVRREIDAIVRGAVPHAKASITWAQPV